MDPLNYHTAVFREQVLRNNWLPLLREASRLMQPIGSFENDEALLVNALAAAQVRQESVQDALYRLHGANCHAENVWRDHYLAHRQRIDMQVDDLLQRLARLRINTAPVSIPQPQEPSMPVPAHAQSGKSPISPIDNPSTSGSGSGSDSSLIVPPNFSPASSSQTSAMLSKRSVFTQEDIDFMVQRMQAALEDDASFNTGKLATSIAEEAPHISMSAWRAAMYRFPDARAILKRRSGGISANGRTADAGSGKLFSDAEMDSEESYEEEEDTDDEEYGSHQQHIPADHLQRASPKSKLFRCMGYDDCDKGFPDRWKLARHIRTHTGKPSFTCHCGKSFLRRDALCEHAQNDHFGKNEHRTVIHSNESASTARVRRDGYTNDDAMGGPGDLYTLGDMKALARLVVEYPGLENLPGHRPGIIIAQKYPQRSSDAWYHAFRRRKDQILALADKMKTDVAVAESAPTTPQELTLPSPSSALSCIPPTKRPRLSMS